MSATPIPVHVIDAGSWWLADFVPVISAIAAVVGAWAAVWALRGLNAAEKNLQITLDQAAKADEERLRQPRLTLFEPPSGLRAELGKSGVAHVNFYVQNRGNRPASNVRIRYVFHGLTNQMNYAGLLFNPLHSMYFDDGRLNEHRIESDIAPDDVVDAGNIMMTAPPGLHEFEWQIKSNEGVWPNSDVFAKTLLEVVPYREQDEPL